MTVQVLPKNQLKRKTIRNLQEIFGFLELVGDFLSVDRMLLKRRKFQIS